MPLYQISEELKNEYRQTERIVFGFVQWLQYCIMDTSRDDNFTKNHLLSFLHQDILETLIGVLVHVHNGIHTPAIRESRFLLELSVKVAFIQKQSYLSSIEKKLEEFDREIKASSITPMKKIDLCYLKEETRPLFLEEVGRLYSTTSSFVHLTPKSIEHRQNRVSQGRLMGQESKEDLTKLNDLLRRVYAVSLVFLSHSVPQYVIGDWHVKDSGQLIDWYFIKSRYIAEIDTTLDYKAERKATINTLIKERQLAVQF